jgi:hypothetical protein
MILHYELTTPPVVHMEYNGVMVRLTDYPQLRFIAWSRRPDGEITEEDALALYETHWDMVDQAALGDNEKALIDRLAREVGHGFLDV